MKVVFLVMFMMFSGFTRELCAMKKDSPFSHDPEQRERVRKAYELGLESARKEVREFLEKIEREKQQN